MPADGGIRFGQYVLLRRIARGGMAEVFLAQQRGLEGFDRRVAVKRILPHLADSPDFLRMFLGEAKLAAQLSHPNIVHIYDFGKVEGDYFIAMEYVEGVHAGQLFKHGEATGPQPGDRLLPVLVARLGADAAAALHYAHELQSPAGQLYGLVHRDVSPANLMVSFDGVVKLCDFGIAKAAAFGDQLTNPGQVKGKYAYMSPEQTIASPLDGRSDVFSLAIVMWELLAGRFIVQRGDAVEAMRALRDGKIEPIERAAPGTPAQLATALRWALEPKRERRATAMDFAQALEAFIKSSPELATPLQLGAWVRARFPRDNSSGQLPALTRADGAGGTVAAPGTVIATSGTQGAITPRTPPRVGGAEAFDASDLDETAETLKAPHRPIGATSLDERAAEEPSGAPTIVAEHTGFASALPQRVLAPPGAAMPPPLGHGPPPARPLDASGPRARALLDSSGPRMLVGPDGTALRARTLLPGEAAHRRRIRLAAAVGGLFVLALVSFLVALRVWGARAPQTSRDGAVARADAGILVEPAPIDAAPAPAPDAPAPPPDAAPPDMLVDIVTNPPGGTITIGDQVRRAPARLALPAGRYLVTAELAGYEPERRQLTVELGDHPILEIAFTHRRHDAPARERSGWLTARTEPYSDVYEAGKKLGQTPFANLELSPGVHELTFVNPAHGSVHKRVVIRAGRETKLGFTLP